MFNYSQSTFPETKFQVGRWLGPAIDVGSALTYKILKRNGRVVPCSTIRHLTLDELTNPDHIAMTKVFDDNIVQKIGVPLQGCHREATLVPCLNSCPLSLVLVSNFQVGRLELRLDCHHCSIQMH